MTEQRITQGLREAVANEPPLRLDVEEIAARERRHQTLRRVLGTVAATVLIAVSATTLPALLELPPETPSADAPSDPFPRWEGLWPKGDDEYLAEEYQTTEDIVGERIAAAVTDHAPEVAVDLLDGNDATFGSEHAEQVWRYPIRLSTPTGTYEAEITAHQGDREVPMLSCSGPLTELAAECETFSLPDEGIGMFQTEVANTSETRVEVVPFERLSVELSVWGTATDPAPLSRSAMTDIALAIAAQ